jgi:RNA polymerase sigma-70 factor (ECF subfamily)
MAVSITAEPVDFEALVRAGQQAVTRYLLARTGSAAEAAELAQETFVRAYCAMSKGDRPRHPLPWLLAIARNVFLEARRSARYQRQLTARMGRLMGREWESPWQEQVESRLVVGEAVDSLPTELREPVLLHYFGGLTVPEVAGHLEITPAAAKTRLYRARQALRGELETLVGEAKKALFVLPRELAAKAKEMAERPGVYEAVDVWLQIGGRHWIAGPMFSPVLSGEVLSLEDLQFAVRQLRAAMVAGDRPLTHKLDLLPVPELFDHPSPIEAWSFLRSAELGNETFQNSEEGHLIATDGWWLGTDPAAPALLAEFRRAGLRHLWFTFAGLGDTHDELCQCPGAFAANIAAMERSREAGIETGANLILSTRNVTEVRELAETVLSLGAERLLPLYVFIWSRQWPEYEETRPTLEDLAGLPPEGLEVNWGKKAFWENPEAFTEGALTRAAMASEHSSYDYAEITRRPNLWVAANLDLCLRVNDAPAVRLMNLRTDDPAQVYRRLAEIQWPAPPPPDAELARRYGDTAGRKLHPGLNCLRQKWLAAWQRESGVPWLPVIAF